MPSTRAKVERITDSEYRIIFDRPLEAEVALMYFGFYPDTRLFWKNGRVVSVIAPSSTYEQVVKDFSEDAGGEEDINEVAGREDF